MVFVFLCLTYFTSTVHSRSMVQRAKFYSFLWPSNIPLCVCVCVCTHACTHITISLSIHLLMNTDFATLLLPLSSLGKSQLLADNINDSGRSSGNEEEY